MIAHESRHEQVKVSVAMLAYNHEEFIAQAIESALMQRTSFPFELVIGEDCSTDGTRKVVQRYAMQRDVIRPLFHASNIGMSANLEAVLAACRGEYVALLDGDDYWTEELKLASQVRFLDEHPEVALCFHDAHFSVRSGGAFRLEGTVCMNAKWTKIGIPEILAGVPIPTCAIMVRRRVLKLPDLIHQSPAPDRFIQLAAALSGEVAYIDEVWGAYRVHESGVYSGSQGLKRIEARLKNLELLDNHLNGSHSKELRAAQSGWHYRAAMMYRDSKVSHKVKKHLLRCAVKWPWHSDVRFAGLAKAFAWFYCRPLYHLLHRMRGTLVDRVARGRE